VKKPKLRRWRIHVIKGKRADYLGTVEVADAACPGLPHAQRLLD
jgi:hypothetical protein